MVDEAGEATQSKARDVDALSVCLVGGKRIVRRAVQEFLESAGISVTWTCPGESELEQRLASGEASASEVVVLIVTHGPFTTFHQIHEVLSAGETQPSVVVVSDHVTRGQVYAALRMGAKAYVSLDAEPAELIKAVRTVGRDQAYLGPATAELLVNDISQGTPNPRASNRGKDLSQRETQVVQLLCEGLSGKEIARHLHISVKTVENHRYNIYRKCHVEGLVGLLRHAVRTGLVSI
jgi:DNA-binding NarL/FixJ family response regulator